MRLTPRVSGSTLRTDSKASVARKQRIAQRSIPTDLEPQARLRPREWEDDAPVGPQPLLFIRASVPFEVLRQRAGVPLCV